MYTYQAGVAQANAAIAERNAQYALNVGETKAQAEGMKVRATIGATKAQQGASGLDVTQGSAVDVRAAEADIGAEEVGTIRSDAAEKAYSLRVEEAADIAQSDVDKIGAKQAKTAGYLGAIGSILGAGSSVSSKWMTAQRSGVNLFS
jgi:hypothetical protein